MLKLVEEHGTRYWALIGAKLNGRTGKQVSLYIQYFLLQLRIIILTKIQNYFTFITNNYINIVIFLSISS